VIIVAYNYPVCFVFALAADHDKEIELNVCPQDLLQKVGSFRLTVHVVLTRE